MHFLGRGRSEYRCGGIVLPRTPARSTTGGARSSPPTVSIVFYYAFDARQSNIIIYTANDGQRTRTTSRIVVIKTVWTLNKYIERKNAWSSMTETGARGARSFASALGPPPWALPAAHCSSDGPRPHRNARTKRFKRIFFYFLNQFPIKRLL